MRSFQFANCCNEIRSKARLLSSSEEFITRCTLNSILSFLVVSRMRFNVLHLHLITVVIFLSLFSSRIANLHNSVHVTCSQLLGFQLAFFLYFFFSPFRIAQFKTSCTDLANCKLTVEHIDQCIQALQRTLPILDHYSRVEQSIREGRFYHALRTLEDLEHQHLDDIKPFAVSEILIHRIPKLRAEIKVSSRITVMLFSTLIVCAHF